MTNEFNFDVKHEDYEEWLNQIEQVSVLIAHYFLSQTLTLNVYVRQKFRKVLLQRWMPTEIIHAGNISAYWIPQIALQREIGGTVYTITGYYEGKTDFLRKLERMTVDRMRRSMEDDINDK